MNEGKVRVLWEEARRGSNLTVQEGLSERVWGCLPQLSPLPSPTALAFV